MINQSVRFLGNKLIERQRCAWVIGFDVVIERNAVVYDGAGHRVLKNFELLLPNGNTATFTAFVKKFNSQGAVDQAVRRSVDLRISGPISWA